MTNPEFRIVVELTQQLPLDVVIDGGTLRYQFAKVSNDIGGAQQMVLNNIDHLVANVLAKPLSANITILVDDAFRRYKEARDAER